VPFRRGSYDSSAAVEVEAWSVTLCASSGGQSSLSRPNSRSRNRSAYNMHPLYVDIAIYHYHFFLSSVNRRHPNLTLQLPPLQFSSEHNPNFGLFLPCTAYYSSRTDPSGVVYFSENRFSLILWRTRAPSWPQRCGTDCRRISHGHASERFLSICNAQ